MSLQNSYLADIILIQTRFQPQCSLTVRPAFSAHLPYLIHNKLYEFETKRNIRYNRYFPQNSQVVLSILKKNILHAVLSYSCVGQPSGFWLQQQICFHIWLRNPQSLGPSHDQSIIYWLQCFCSTFSLHRPQLCP